MTLIFIANLFSTFQIVAAEVKPACTMAAITQDCRLFKERKDSPVIVLPDGSEIPNPLYVKPQPQTGMPTAPPVPSVEKMAEDFRENTRNQVKLLRAWDSLPRSQRVSDEFKVTFQTALLTPALQAWANGTPPIEGPFPLILPWPPGKKGAEFRSVNSAELSAFLNRLPRPQRTLIASQAKEAAQRFSANYMTGSRGERRSRGTNEIPTATPEQKERIEKAVEYAREAMQQDLLRGRRPEELSVEEKGYLAKIRTVRLEPLDISRNSPACTARTSPAWYVPNQHAIVICPDMYKTPMADLIFVLGHEIGHSIDPCNGRCHLLAVNHAKLGDQMPPEIRTEIESNRELKQVVDLLKNSGGPFSVLRYREATDGDRVEKRLLELGLIQIEGQRVKNDEGDPNRKMWQCLLSTAQVRPADDRQLAAMADEVERLLRVNNERIKDPSELRKNLLLRLQENRHCLTTPIGPSQISEAASDAHGARVLGRWLKENPPKTDEDRLAVVAFFGNEQCTLENPAAADDSRLQDLFFIQRVLAINKNQPHPENHSRLERILLTEPRVQAAMGCKGDPKYNCFAEQLPSGAASSEPVSGSGVER